MFNILKKDDNSLARAGIIETPHGVIETPAYAIVGTDAKVRTLNAGDIVGAKTRLIIVNTYHMWRALGNSGLNSFTGLHNAMGWHGPLMTDSGGFQVFSLGFSREHGIGKVTGGNRDTKNIKENLVKITDDGVYFYDNGEELYLDAEKSMKVQKQLGADIIFAFDECTSPKHDYEYNRQALIRTHKWAERSLKARDGSQLLYGIVQGGAFEDLRRESAKVIGSIPFDGIGIGGSFGSSFGSLKEDTFRELEWVMPHLPEDKPRHLLGIGKVDDLFECVAKGIDTFDCVVPTREARHGSLWTANGRFDITKGRYGDDKKVIDEKCGCPVCAKQKVERGYLHQLFREKNMEAGRLATIHNVYFFNDIMQKIREAIMEGCFAELKNVRNRASNNLCEARFRTFYG